MKIFWFSGTGNSLWAAKKLAYATKAELVSLADTLNLTEIPVEDDAVGFVFPTYLGDIPWPAKEMLLKLRAKPGTYFFAVMTSTDGDSGLSFCCIDQALHSLGHTLSLARNLQMPGNLLPKAVKAQEDILKEAPTEVKDILGDIFDRKVNYKSENKNPGKRFVESTPFYSPKALIKRFRIADRCTGCGTCAKLCPMGNIAITDGNPVRGSRCAACFACMHWCPEHATISKLPVIKKRTQYHHPSIRMKDFGKK